MGADKMMESNVYSMISNSQVSSYVPFREKETSTGATMVFYNSSHHNLMVARIFTWASEYALFNLP